MALPPLLAGAVNVTDTDATPPVAVPIVGAPGTVAAPAGEAITAEMLSATAAGTTTARANRRRNVYFIAASRPDPYPSPRAQRSDIVCRESRTLRQRARG